MKILFAPDTGKLLGAQATGAQGIVVGGPISASGFSWWQMNYNSGADGWSAENFLVKVTTSSPAPSPTPYPTPSPTPTPTTPTPSPSGTLVVFTKPIYFWDRTEVKKLQITLNKALGLTLKVDGIYGKATTAAIKPFQSVSGLKPDGIVGVLTRAKLNAVKAVMP